LDDDEFEESLFAGLGAAAPPVSDDEEPDDEELDDSLFFGDGAGLLPPSDPPPPGPPPGPAAAGARFHRSGREAGRGEVGCAETWAASRTEGDTAESAVAATGGVKPGPANIAQATTSAPTPGARDQTTTRGTSRGRLLDGTNTTHPHVGQVRTRPRRKIKKTGQALPRRARWEIRAHESSAVLQHRPGLYGAQA